MTATTAPHRVQHPVPVAVVVLVQLLLLGVVAWGPVIARFTGTPVQLKVGVADPTDPFHDDYLDLSYPDLPQQPQSMVPLEPEEGPTHEGEPTPGELPPEEVGLGTTFVPLTRQGDLWVGGKITRTRPVSGRYLTCDDRNWRLQCGIERWFLPGAEGTDVGRALRRGTAIATVKVDAQGRAALVGISAR